MVIWSELGFDNIGVCMEYNIVIILQCVYINYGNPALWHCSRWSVVYSSTLKPQVPWWSEHHTQWSLLPKVGGRPIPITSHLLHCYRIRPLKKHRISVERLRTVQTRSHGALPTTRLCGGSRVLSKLGYAVRYSLHSMKFDSKQNSMIMMYRNIYENMTIFFHITLSGDHRLSFIPESP